MIKEIVINVERKINMERKINEINEFLYKGNFKNLTQILKNSRALSNFNQFFLICVNRLKVTYI